VRVRVIERNDSAGWAFSVMVRGWHGRRSLRV
jgi:hypothetical protein